MDSGRVEEALAVLARAQAAGDRQESRSATLRWPARVTDSYLWLLRCGTGWMPGREGIAPGRA